VKSHAAPLVAVLELCHAPPRPSAATDRATTLCRLLPSRCARHHRTALSCQAHAPVRPRRPAATRQSGRCRVPVAAVQLHWRELMLPRYCASARAGCRGQRASQPVLLGRRARGPRPVLHQPAAVHCAAGLAPNSARVALFHFNILFYLIQTIASSKYCTSLI
jgi:hypothetical protein